MSRIAHYSTAVVLTLVLLGAGCNTSSSTTEDTRQNDLPTRVPISMDSKTDGDDVIELKATAVGTNQVEFAWELNRSVAEPDRFILIRGDEPNPLHDNKNFWFRQHGTKRSATWSDLPAGEQYFRICTSEDGDTCDAYSDDIAVEVLGGSDTDESASTSTTSAE